MSYFTTDAYKPDAVIVRRPDTARASSELRLPGRAWPVHRPPPMEEGGSPTYWLTG